MRDRRRGPLGVLGAAVAVASGLAQGGCGDLEEPASFDPEDFRIMPGWVVVADVPLPPEGKIRDCGTAALSMVLAYWKVPIDSAELSSSGLLKLGGRTQPKDLRDYARAKGLESTLLRGEWGDLLRELSLGRPVIVGLAKPAEAGAVIHYEVVVAVHPDRGLVVTHDPASGWLETSLAEFRREWDSAGALTLVFYRAEGERRSTLNTR